MSPFEVSQAERFPAFGATIVTEKTPVALSAATNASLTFDAWSRFCTSRLTTTFPVFEKIAPNRRIKMIGKMSAKNRPTRFRT